MRKMTSGINSIPAGTLKAITGLKAAQDNTTTQLASDSSGIVGAGDIDLIRFLTAPFTGYRMLQTGGAGGSTYGTLAIIPDQQQTLPGQPFYRDGMIMALDRAGGGNFGFNVARGGPKPDGYAKGNQKYIQRRTALRFNPAIDRVSYQISVISVPVDYVLQPDERLDGDFFPGSMHYGVGQPYGQPDMTVYNNDPYGPDGWNGTVNTVPDNSATQPVIDSVEPNVFQLGLPDEEPTGIPIQFWGRNFTGAGFVGVGPFGSATGNSYLGQPPEPPGAYFTRMIESDNQISVYMVPPTGSSVKDLPPGVYTPWVIGVDGQVGFLQDGFTILAPVDSSGDGGGSGSGSGGGGG